jgi:hypothetical protein
MRQIVFIICTFSFLFSACQTKKSNYDELLNLPQVPFPAGQDKKWKAIKSLGESKDSEAPDVLYQVYLSIDTTLKGHVGYNDAIFNTLIDINTEKSAVTLGKIYTNRPPDHLSQSVLISLSQLKHYEKLFPSILNNLKPNIINAVWILELLKKGIEEQKISKQELESYLPVLEDFYYYSKNNSTYFEICSPILIKCLTGLTENQATTKILTELLESNTTNYKISWPAFKALKGTVNPTNYLNQICQNKKYRLDAYNYLNEINKDELFPKEFLNQESLSECISISSTELRHHDTEAPYSIKYKGMKSLKKGNYYFYLLCWYESNCNRSSLVVTGPQPIDKSQFNQTPTYKGELVGENLKELEIKAAIEKYKE